MANGDSFRLQIYDDGAGEYIFDSPVSSLIGGGTSGITAMVNASNAVGPFIVPSPKAVTKPGLLTVMLSNVNTPENEGMDSTNPVVGSIALVFAVPKRCKGQSPTGMQDRSGRGVMG